LLRDLAGSHQLILRFLNVLLEDGGERTVGADRVLESFGDEIFHFFGTGGVAAREDVELDED